MKAFSCRFLFYSILYSKFELCWGAYLCVHPEAEALDSSLKNPEIVCPYFWKACWRRGIVRAARKATRGGHGELKWRVSQHWHCISRGFKAVCPKAASSWNNLENSYLDQAIEKTDLRETKAVYSWGRCFFLFAGKNAVNTELDYALSTQVQSLVRFSSRYCGISLVNWKDSHTSLDLKTRNILQKVGYCVGCLTREILFFLSTGRERTGVQL